MIRSRGLGGFGLNGQWADDFHHCVHTLLTGEQEGYYGDFGSPEQMAKAFENPFVFSGQYSPVRQRSHGADPIGLPPWHFVVCIQNHDQVGNRGLGDRLSHLVDFYARKTAAAAMILSPYIPMLFMGEEYDETAPFQYFTSHGDGQLAEAVRKGRREEFKSFTWSEEVPDPQSEETFERSKLQWGLRKSERGSQMLKWYSRLLSLRKYHPALGPEIPCRAQAEGRLIKVERKSEHIEVMLLLNFSPEATGFHLPGTGTNWNMLLNSHDREIVESNYPLGDACFGRKKFQYEKIRLYTRTLLSAPQGKSLA